ncbi:Preprotein translocase subunit SECE1 [Linum perenne]
MQPLSPSSSSSVPPFSHLLLRSTPSPSHLRLVLSSDSSSSSLLLLLFFVAAEQSRDKSDLIADGGSAKTKNLRSSLNFRTLNLPSLPLPLASSPTTQGFGSERLSTTRGSPIGGMFSSLRFSFLGVPGWVSQLKGMGLVQFSNLTGYLGCEAVGGGKFTVVVPTRREETLLVISKVIVAVAGAMGARDSRYLFNGVAEEVREIEWPSFDRVLGTIGVVLGVIAGSNVVLLTINA